MLVGHSYGGSVIRAAAMGKKNVIAFAPEAGETAIGLSGKFPGATLGEALAPPVPLGNGKMDLYIEQSKFRLQLQCSGATSRVISEKGGVPNGIRALVNTAEMAEFVPIRVRVVACPGGRTVAPRSGRIARP